MVVDRIGREIVRNAGRAVLPTARATAKCSPRTRSTSSCSRRSTGHVAERELQLYGPPRQVLQLASFPLRRDGEVVGAVAFTRDVSEARRVESVRRDFVANVSHELKTPIGALGLLAETMAATDDSASCGSWRIESSARPTGSSRIVDDLLDLSTIEAQEAPSRAPDPVACSCRRRSISCRPRPTRPGCRFVSRPSRPTSRSRATAARCAARW